MKIVALDTSSKAGSCAFLDNELLVGEFFINASITHSQTILPMLESLFLHSEKNLEDTDVFAVSCGPGSFTGLRIGISAVKGMAMALNKPCVAVSTIQSLAYNLVGYKGLILPVMDARRQQVYTGLFRGDNSSIAQLVDDTAVEISALPEIIHKNITLGEDIFLVGDGAELCYNVLKEQVKALQIAPINLLYQRASSVAVLAKEIIAKGGSTTASRLEPFYLRLPQAQRELLEKEGRN